MLITIFTGCKALWMSANFKGVLLKHFKNQATLSFFKYQHLFRNEYPSTWINQ